MSRHPNDIADRLAAMLRRARLWIENDNTVGWGPSEIAQHRLLLSDMDRLLQEHQQ